MNSPKSNIPRPVRLEATGVIDKISTPFSWFRKPKTAIVHLRTAGGSTIALETNPEYVAQLPISIGVGMYAEASYRKTPDGKYLLDDLS